MPLMGSAAMVLGFDIVPESMAEHDDWHTHEHMPERLGVPGFLRGSRWRAVRGSPDYLVLYEVATLEVLTSPAYLQRLNHPTPWTTRMMPAYRNMSRGLCAVRSSHGHGLGGHALVLRLQVPEPRRTALRDSLGTTTLQALASRRGISSTHWLESAVAAPMTHEQSLRGADRAVDTVVWVTAYDEHELAAIEATELDPARLQAAGVSAEQRAVYRLAHTLHAL